MTLIAAPAAGTPTQPSTLRLARSRRKRSHVAITDRLTNVNATKAPKLISEAAWNRSSLHDEMDETMYSRQLATYTGVLERGIAAEMFAPQIDVPTLAITLVTLEDAYGLHIVGGNSLIDVSAAEQAMRRVAESLGAVPGRGRRAT